MYGKSEIFKTLALSKIIYLALVTNATTVIIELLSKVQKEFLWGKNNDYENGGVKSADMFLKNS